jgi:hypothetical protein
MLSLLHHRDLPLSKPDRAGKVPSNEDKQGDGKGDCSTDSTRSSRRDSPELVRPDGLPKRLVIGRSVFLLGVGANLS